MILPGSRASLRGDDREMAMDRIQARLSGFRTILGLFGDSFLVAVAISAAVSTAVILATSVLTGG
jgi:hypothetical protein